MQRKVFHKRIKELRLHAGFSQRFVASHIGVSAAYLSKIEKGVVIPSRTVIIRLAEILSIETDELLMLAGKLPSDIAEQLRNNPESLKSLRKGKIAKRGSTFSNRRFGERLRELREGFGISQGALAKKLGVSFTYLSKIENGIKPPPSQNLIQKIAEIFEIDNNELIALSGRVPEEVINKLQDKKFLNAFRSSLEENIDTRRARSMRFIKNLFSMRRLSRIAMPVMLVIAVAASLVFVAPLPATAVDFSFTPANPAGYVGSPMTFTLKVLVQDVDKLPIQGVKVLFSDKPYGQTTYYNEYKGLPVGDSTTININSVSGATNSIAVSATTSEGWAYVPNSTRYGYGYGYGSGVWSWITKTLNTGYGYGYGYSGTNVGDAWIQYTITWTPPSSWPTGTYYVTAFVLGNADESYIFAEDTSFTLSSAFGGGGAAAPSVTTTTTETETTANTRNVVTATGRFTTRVTVTPPARTGARGTQTASLVIPLGTSGLTSSGQPIASVLMGVLDDADLDSLPLPPAQSGFTNRYLAGVNIDMRGTDGLQTSATFDEPCTLTIQTSGLPAGTPAENVLGVHIDNAGTPTTVGAFTDNGDGTYSINVIRFSKYALMLTEPIEEEVPVVISEPVDDEPVIEDEPIVEDEPVVEEEDTPVVEDEKPVTTEEPVAEEEEPAGGMAWWVWLIIGIAIVAVVAVAYIYWLKPRMAS